MALFILGHRSILERAVAQVCGQYAGAIGLTGEDGAVNEGEEARVVEAADRVFGGGFVEGGDGEDLDCACELGGEGRGEGGRGGEGGGGGEEGGDDEEEGWFCHGSGCGWLLKSLT